MFFKSLINTLQVLLIALLMIMGFNNVIQTSLNTLEMNMEPTGRLRLNITYTKKE